jgi:hypothetical protein
VPRHAILWFRRDLRLRATALAEAESGPLVCFIFDDRLITGGRFLRPHQPCSAARGAADLRELGSTSS